MYTVKDKRRNTGKLIAAVLATLLASAPVMADRRHDYDRGYQDNRNFSEYRHQGKHRGYRDKRYRHHRHHYHHPHKYSSYKHRHHYPVVRVYGDDDGLKWLSVAAVTIKVLDNINEDQAREHDRPHHRR